MLHAGWLRSLVQLWISSVRKMGLAAFFMFVVLCFIFMYLVATFGVFNHALLEMSGIKCACMHVLCDYRIDLQSSYM